MKSSLVVSLAVWGSSQIALAKVPTWPTPEIDELEDIRFLQTGYSRRGFVDFVAPCGFSSSGNGRITAAEWIRTAYHDMATADVTAGTGGLDASIQFETERGENIGIAMNSTLQSMLGYYTYRSSMADLLALGVFTSVINCGGPVLPFRVGRVDATEAGPVGVPEPSDNITTITDKFARQGFNMTDMIALVACGHTLGGVHGEDFPTIVTDNGTAGHNFSHFDTTTHFDNLVATEYISGNTTNPLVVGPDPGMNSDLAVFSADGNKTMARLTDPTTFQDTCLSVLERMIDTVPSTVTLTEPLVAYPIKPRMTLALSADGSKLDFSGSIRVRTTERPATNISGVTLNYRARDGVSGGVINAKIATFQGGTTGGFNEFFQWYEFDATLDANSSISAFNVSVALNNGTVEEHTNNGAGFPVQSNIIFQQSRSCSVVNATGTSTLNIVAAVHNSRKQLPAKVVSHVRVPRQGSIVPAWDQFDTKMTFVNSTGPYDLFAAAIPVTGTQVFNTYIDLVSGRCSDVESDLFHTMSGLAEC